MSLSPWDKFYYWMTGSFPKKTAKRVHDEFEKLQKSAKKAFAEEDSSLAKKSEPKPKAKAAAPKAPVKKTSATKATPVTKAKPKSAGKSSTSSSSNKKSSK